MQKKILLISFAVSTLFENGFAQINTPSGATKPFGTNASYEYGIMPTNLPTTGTYGRASEVGTIYNSWKTQYVENCGTDKARVRFDNTSETVSEGIAYGMLLAVYAADKDLFDRLWAYYKQHRNGNGVMHWKISGCNNVIGQNGATDAELDAAMALIVATKQWPTSTTPHNYKTDGVALVNAIRQYEVNSDGTFENGDAWKPTCRNPSYQAPAYAKAFKLFMAENGQNQNAFWENVSAKTEALFANNAHATSGLSTNWCTPQGPPSGSCSGSGTAPDKFGYDACRAPWRQGVDVLWWGASGTGQVQTVINRQADFWITKGGATSVQGSNNLNHDGSGSGDHNGAFTGPIGAMSLGVVASTSRQTFANGLYTENKRSQMGNGYFTTILQMIGLFVQTGNFWNPYATTSGGTANTPPTISITANNTSVCQGVSINLSANASDADGLISKVEFYNGTTLLDTKTASPYTYTWTPTASGSASITAKAYDDDNAVTTSTAVSITVNTAPSAPGVTSAVSYCLNSTAAQLQASGQNLKWYTVSTAGTSSATAPTPSTSAGGNTNYYVSQTTNGCESARSQITVTVNQATAPTVTTPVNYCQGQQASALTANGTGLKWYTQSSGGTSATSLTPSTANTGNTSYYVSQTVNNCESPRATITVSVGTATSAPTVTPQVAYCQNVSASPLAAIGQNLKWYTAQTGGTASTTAIIPSTVNTGSTAYFVSQTVGGCESNRTSITVTVNAAPSVPVVTTPVTYNINETANQLTATGQNLKWYTSASGGTASSTAPTPNTAQTGTTLFYVSQTNSNNCESNRASIQVRVISAISVGKTNLAPVIDGTVDAIWSNATIHQITKTIQGTISNPNDLSGTFKLLWDNNYFYILGQVVDDTKLSDSEPVYEDDGVEVYFDFGNDKATAYANNDAQFSFKWNSTAISTNPNGKNTSGINFSMLPTAGGYTFEARFAWSNLGGASVANQLHGFDFHINDDDNGGTRDGKLSWSASTDDAWQNTTLFGTIVLKETYDTITSVEKNDLLAERLSFYPNPFQSEIRLQGLKSQASYSIVDLNGKVVQAGTTEGVIVTDIDAGVYTLIVTSGTVRQTLKVVKID